MIYCICRQYRVADVKVRIMKKLIFLIVFVSIGFSSLGQDSTSDTLGANPWSNIGYNNEIYGDWIDDLAYDALLHFFDYRKNCIDPNRNENHDFPRGEFVDMTMKNHVYIQKNLDTLDLRFIDCRQYQTDKPKDRLRVTYLCDIYGLDGMEFFFLSLSLRQATRKERELENYADMVLCCYGAFKVVYKYNSENKWWEYDRVVRCY